MDGNSLIRLLLGIPGSPEKGLGFLHSVPHRTPSLYPCWGLPVGRELDSSSSWPQDLAQGLLRSSACGMKKCQGFGGPVHL